MTDIWPNESSNSNLLQKEYELLLDQYASAIDQIDLNISVEAEEPGRFNYSALEKNKVGNGERKIDGSDIQLMKNWKQDGDSYYLDAKNGVPGTNWRAPAHEGAEVENETFFSIRIPTIEATSNVNVTLVFRRFAHRKYAYRLKLFYDGKIYQPIQKRASLSKLLSIFGKIFPRFLKLGHSPYVFEVEIRNASNCFQGHLVFLLPEKEKISKKDFISPVMLSKIKISKALSSVSGQH